MGVVFLAVFAAIGTGAIAGAVALAVVGLRRRKMAAGGFAAVLLCGLLALATGILAAADRPFVQFGPLHLVLTAFVCALPFCAAHPDRWRRQVA